MLERTLRDQFALAAMQALLTASPIRYDRGDDGQAQINYITTEAYRVADAMLSERNFNTGEKN